MCDLNAVNRFVLADSKRPSRRDFIYSGGLVAGAMGLGFSITGQASEPRNGVTTTNALERLLEGNRRFATGTSACVRRTPQDFISSASGQEPFAAIVACADSRVAPELIFDQGIGDLFVVRVAGNVVSGAGPLITGSLEYAVAELGVKLIMVLGHSNCGAVQAAIAHVEEKDTPPGAIGELVALIEPAVIAARGRSGDMLGNVIQANVARCVARLKGLEPIVSAVVKRGEVAVVGGVYELSTGAVSVIA